MIEILNSLYNGLMTMLNTNLMSLFAIILLCLLLAVIGFVNKKFQEFLKRKLDPIISVFKEKITGGITPEMRNKINQIYVELAELRVKLNASRCFIVEIHNGEMFASGDHIWKMSISYENVKRGVTYIGKDWQDMSASLFWNDFTRTLFLETREPLPVGIENIEPKFKMCKGGCFSNNTCLMISVGDMKTDSGIMRVMLDDSGVSHMLYSPIFLNNNLLGYVAVQYDNSNEFIQTYNSGFFVPCLLCRFGAHIATVWNGNPKQKRQMLTHQKRLSTK